MFSFEETRKYIEDTYQVIGTEEWDNGDVVLGLAEDSTDVVKDMVDCGRGGHIFDYEDNSVVVTRDVTQYLGEDYEYINEEDVNKAQVHVTELKYFLEGMKSLAVMTFRDCGQLSGDEGLTPTEIMSKRTKLESGEGSNVVKFSVEFESEEDREDFLAEWCEACGRLWTAEYNGFDIEYIRESLYGSGLRDAVTGKYVVVCEYTVFEDYKVAEPMDSCGGRVDKSLLDSDEFVKSRDEKELTRVNNIVDRYAKLQKDARFDIAVFEKGICVSSPFGTGIGKFLIENTNKKDSVKAFYKMCADDREFDGVDWYEDGFYCMGNAVDFGQEAPESAIECDTSDFLAMMSLVNPCEDLADPNDAMLNGFRVYEWSKDRHVIGLELFKDEEE